MLTWYPQSKLFHSIKPLFLNKPVILVINKIDIVRMTELSPENRVYIDSILSDKSVISVEASCYSDEGVMAVRNAACEALLAARVEQKLKGTRINLVANKIHVAMPVKRDEVDRAPFIPDVVKERKKYDKMDPERRLLERDEEQALDGVDIFRADTRSRSSACSVLTFRGIPSRGRFLEVRHYARVPQWQECCRLCRPGYRGEARGTGARGRGTGSSRLLRFGRGGNGEHCGGLC